MPSPRSFFSSLESEKKQKKEVRFSLDDLMMSCDGKTKRRKLSRTEEQEQEQEEILFEQTLTCDICKDYFVLPMSLETCPHAFCFACLREHANRCDPTNRTCPLCGTKMTTDFDGNGSLAWRGNAQLEAVINAWRKKNNNNKKKKKKKNDLMMKSKIKKIPPGTQYSVIGSNKKSEVKAKENKLRDDLAKKYGFDEELLRSNSYEELLKKYKTFRDTFNITLEEFHRTPNQREIVQDIERVEIELRSVSDSVGAALMVKNAVEVVNPKNTFFDAVKKKKTQQDDDCCNNWKELFEEAKKKLSEKYLHNLENIRTKDGEAKTNSNIEGVNDGGGHEKDISNKIIVLTDNDDTLTNEEDDEDDDWQNEPLPLSQPNPSFFVNSK